MLLLCGDAQQQQPIATVDGKTKQTKSILNHKALYDVCTTVNFHTQHRCEDKDYAEILDTIRYHKPSRTLLVKLERDRVLFQKTEIEDKDIRSVLLNQPEAVILTVSCAAASRVNRVALDSLFEDQQFLGEVQYDNELGRVALYRGMKVLITQNRDKEHGVVNGQPATVLYHENASIFLEHPKGYICCIYPVTQRDSEGKKYTVYPIAPAYVSTITKIQGQNMKKIILWLDCPTVPKGGAYVALSRIRNKKA